MGAKSVQMAHQIWPILIDRAVKRQTITYGELGAQFGITGRALQNFNRILDPIKYYCLQHSLPKLHALVVQKKTGLPGPGANADEKDIQAVFAYDWRTNHPLVPSLADLAV